MKTLSNLILFVAINVAFGYILFVCFTS